MLRAYNSIYVIDHDGSILSVYDKMHLVPFGEYLPFQDFLESLGLMQLTKVRGGYIPGTARKPITRAARAARSCRWSVTRSCFPGEAVPRGERPGWLVNLTNDGWFGRSSGPYQHLQQARVRAIEEGLPLVRAANTGVSAVIDPVGRIVALVAARDRRRAGCSAAAAARADASMRASATGRRASGAGCACRSCCGAACGHDNAIGPSFAVCRKYPLVR